MLAAKFAGTDMVRILVAAGASMDERDMKGRTALFFAKQREHGEIIKLLKNTKPANGVSL